MISTGKPNSPFMPAYVLVSRSMVEGIRPVYHLCEERKIENEQCSSGPNRLQVWQLKRVEEIDLNRGPESVDLVGCGLADSPSRVHLRLFIPSALYLSTCFPAFKLL